MLSVIKLVNWRKIAETLATDRASEAVRGILRRLGPSEREIALRQACELFTKEFLEELEATTPLTTALPGYRDRLRRLLEYAAPDIAEWVTPEPSDVNFDSVARLWRDLNLDPLPEDFSWARVAKNYERAIRKYVRNDPTLRTQLQLALQEHR